MPPLIFNNFIIIVEENLIMAFVIETISEEQKVKLDPEIFHHPHDPWHRLTKTRRWVSDNAREIFILCLGGGGGPWEGGGVPKPREHFALSWKGQIVKFEAICSTEGSLTKWVSLWEIMDVDIPPCLETQRSILLGFIRDGLKIMANPSTSPEGCIGVTVIFNHQIQQ